MAEQEGVKDTLAQQEGLPLPWDPSASQGRARAFLIPHGLSPSPSDLVPRGSGVSGGISLASPARMGPELSVLPGQVLDPELEVADLAFPPSTISASSLKMQVSGGRERDPG